MRRKEELLLALNFTFIEIMMLPGLSFSSSRMVSLSSSSSSAVLDLVLRRDRVLEVALPFFV